MWVFGRGIRSRKRKVVSFALAKQVLPFFLGPNRPTFRRGVTESGF